MQYTRDEPHGWRARTKQQDDHIRQLECEVNKLRGLFRELIEADMIKDVDQPCVKAHIAKVLR